MCRINNVINGQKVSLAHKAPHFAKHPPPFFFKKRVFPKLTLVTLKKKKKKKNLYKGLPSNVVNQQS